MPTAFPKASPSELQGLLVLLNEHKGNEDIARLADDLDLEIDEILPSIDYAETLGLLKVVDGRATLTDIGRRLLSASIRERKTVLREQLKKTTLFKTIVRALESAPDGRLTEEDVQRLLAFTTAPSDSYVLNIINWGRHAELFRYDSDEHALIATQSRPSPRSPPSSPPSNPGAPDQGTGRRSPKPPAEGSASPRESTRPASAVTA
ncbi:MAG TPA: AAA-associated domain-containing protein [Thermoplasmata archaeon]|nr:AAA-associated domain-containing protein [Thermoplasmata archaeon]